MKAIAIVAFFLLSGSVISAQDLKTFRLYNPAADATKGIDSAVAAAKSQGKNVFVQVGGNWCIWCARFNEFTTKDKQIDSLVNASFVVYHLNYSEENKNAELLAKYRYPQRFGFPVFLILNDRGELLHTQNSSYLEEGKSYSRKNVMGFFSDWSPRALNADSYKE